MSWRSTTDLRGDAGVIHAGLPEHVLAAHALEADQHVLQGVVERMAHMQRAGDVRRRNDDAIRLGGLAIINLAASGERAGLQPALINGALDLGGLKGLLKHGWGLNNKHENVRSGRVLKRCPAHTSTCGDL